MTSKRPPPLEAPETGVEALAALQAQLDSTRALLAETQAERDRLAEREKLLRSELQHRVRNMLAVVRSIFTRTVDAGGDPDALADHFIGRLDTIARYQSFQALEPGRTVDLETMIRDELRSFQFGDDQRIEISGPSIDLHETQVLAVGLALHELTTNALKFGALADDDRPGRLRISWRLEDRLLRLEWEETGVHVLRSAPPHRGFGQAFIEEALPYQLGAATSIDLRAGGLFCTIDVQLAAPSVPLATTDNL